MTVATLIRAGSVQACRPWPRYLLTLDGWSDLARALVAEPNVSLTALWADPTHVHALFCDEVAAEVLLASVTVTDGGYPALSTARPGAAWYERAIADLWGHQARGGTDHRPWLDHGRWLLTSPLAARPGPQGRPPEPPEFLPAAEAGTDQIPIGQIPIGPVHGLITAAAHLRLHAAGTNVARAESRLGYTHKGTLALMRGKSPRAAARFAARLSAAATVAHATAFANAAEAALEVQAPPRAVGLRAVMAELERIADHLDTVGAVCAAAGLELVNTQCGRLRETLARAAATAFGHRLMMDAVIPGGVASDMLSGGENAIGQALDAVAVGVARLRDLHETHAGLIGRLRGTGRVSRAQAALLAAGGIVGRATGLTRDARGFPGYAPYDPPAAAALAPRGGDAQAANLLRLVEIAGSIELLRSWLPWLPDGPISLILPVGSGEGVGVVEGAQGDIWHWLRLEGGLIAACFPRDPGWAHFPLLEAALAGGDVADVPLVRANFALSASGVDL